eukprot:COSAG04_NODE_224_length_19624_cov_47.932855_1_plen_70_part_00
MAKRQALEEDAKARALAFNVKQVEKVTSTKLLARSSLENFVWKFRPSSLGCVVSSDTPPAFRAAFPNYL